MYDTMTMGTYRDAPAINQAMGRVYFHMMCAVVVSMLVSYFVGNDPAAMQFFFTGAMKWVTIFQLFSSFLKKLQHVFYFSFRFK